MKRLLIAGMVLLSSSVMAEECNFLKGLSPYQKEVAYQAYRAGDGYDLGNTMVAIAWKESKLGLYKVRYGITKYDQSFGVMHTVAHWKTKGLSSFKKGVWIQGVIENNPLSIQTGLTDLLYWKVRSKGDWFNMVGSYNGGNTPNKDYASDVSILVDEIKQCGI